MAIQFRCPGCSQPIEVDDIHALGNATCPYCRRVVAVPAASDLGAPGLAAARPAADLPGNGDAPAAVSRPLPPPPPFSPAPEQLHVGPSMTYRDQLARTYGNYALICTALFIVIFVATTIYSFSAFMQTYGSNPASQPMVNAAESAKFASDHPGIIAGSLGSLFFGIVGLALGIVSVKQTTRENWRGILSVVLCGLFVLFFCAINALGMFIGGLGGVAG
jgi:hypothetical protein